MPYASAAILETRYGTAMLVSLTDRSALPTGAVDAAIVAQALADTDAVIDGYLKERYVLPLAEVPALVVDLAQAIAIYKLHRYTPDEKIAQDYRDAMRMLAEIGRGVIQLSVAGVEAPVTGGGGARLTDRDRPMTAANLRGFI